MKVNESQKHAKMQKEKIRDFSVVTPGGDP